MAERKKGEAFSLSLSLSLSLYKAQAFIFVGDPKIIPLLKKRNKRFQQETEQEPSPTESTGAVTATVGLYS
jgi:hypothetical protein